MDFIDKNTYQSCYGIYGIENQINGKIYIGQTGENFLRRYWHHRWKLKNNSHDNVHLQNAWNEYGEDNFNYIVLKTVEDKSLLDNLEIQYIGHFKEIGLRYNMLLGGGGRRGFKMSENTKKKIAEKNHKHMLGNRHSKETRKKMSEIRKGIHVQKKTDILNKDIVRTIKISLIEGNTASKISKELNIDYKLINNLISNNTWKSVIVDGWDEYLSNRKTYKRLSKKDHREIYRLHFEEDYSVTQLSKMYNRTTSMIKKILKDNSNKLYDDPVPSDCVKQSKV